LSIFGENLGEHEACVCVGGYANGLKGVQVQSAGGEVTRTLLAAGVFLERELQLKKLRELQGLCVQNLRFLIESLPSGCVLSNNPHPFVDTLSDKHKALLKTHLEKIQQRLHDLVRIEENSKQLREGVYALDDSVFIEVISKIKPDLFVRLGEKSTLIKVEMDGPFHFDTGYFSG
ncbi:MAG: hypothetical protein HQL32_16280, partial [Planctomycetes bacterium]|nr:hypothetical protein [Planctomycetota bacterium]